MVNPDEKVNQINIRLKKISETKDKDLEAFNNMFKITNYQLNLDQMISNSITRFLNEKKLTCTAAVLVNSDSTTKMYLTANKLNENENTGVLIENATHLMEFIKDHNNSDIIKKQILFIKENLDKNFKNYDQRNMKTSIDIEPQNQGRKNNLKILNRKFVCLLDVLKNNITIQNGNNEFKQNFNSILKFLERKEIIKQFKNPDSKIFIDMTFKSLLSINYLWFDTYVLMYSKNVIVIDEYKIVDNPNKVHCELQLTFCLLEEGIENWRYVGISKLCCPLCRKNLDCIQKHAKKCFDFSGNHDNFIPALRNYKIPTCAKKYDEFIKCFGKWVENISNSKKQYFSETCDCLDTTTRNYVDLYKIEGYNASQDICILHSQLSDPRKTFITEKHEQFLKLFPLVHDIVKINESILKLHEIFQKKGDDTMDYD